MRVLLVEDNLDLVMLLTAGIAKSGFMVDAVGTAGEAGRALEIGRYDAVVLDLGLPDEDGLDLLRRWRRPGNTTAVVVLTARDSVSDRSELSRQVQRSISRNLSPWNCGKSIWRMVSGHRAARTSSAGIDGGSMSPSGLQPSSMKWRFIGAADYRPRPRIPRVYCDELPGP